MKINKQYFKYFFAILVSYFALGTGSVIAQIDIDSLSRESPYGPFTTRFFTEEQIRWNDTTLHYVDTIPNNFQRVDMVWKSDFRYQNLGNLGTSLWPIYYEAPKQIGKTTGFYSYEPYFNGPDKIKYYNTRSPFSSVKVLFGGARRSIIDVAFSRNITPNWNFGFDAKTIHADKQVNSSGQGDRNAISWSYNFYTSYRTDDGKYHVLANFSRLRSRVFESGGIIPPEIDPTSELFGYNDNAKVWLQGAESAKLKVNGHIYHQFQLDPRLQLYHIFDIGMDQNIFENESLSGESSYFDRFLIDEGETFEASRLNEVQNEVGVKGSVNLLYYNFYVKARSMKYRSKYLPEFDVENENYAGSNIKLAITDDVNLKFHGEYLFGGHYQLSGIYESNWLDAKFVSSDYRPSFLANDYFGNHYEWHNDFNSVKSQVIAGAIKLNLGKQFLSPRLNLSTISNYIYFDQNKLPQQAVEDITMLSPGFDFRVHFLKHMHLDSRVTYTLIEGGAADKMRIPELMVNTRLYFEDNIFNDVMWAQIGFDTHWQSDYFGNDYDPVTQQFFLQDHFVIPSYFLADVFISFKVKRFRWFLKFTNVLQGLEADGYFTAPYYTGQKRTFDFGVDWMFFD